MRTECLTSRFERTIGSNEVRANLHELVSEPGLWERITTVGASNDGKMPARTERYVRAGNNVLNTDESSQLAYCAKGITLW